MINIRKGTPADVEPALRLIKELAEYEKAPEQVINTVEQMLKDGFGEKPIFDLLVAETNDNIVGIAIYFIKYSTWKGKCLYLDDIVVQESLRGKGIGRKLFDAVAAEAKLQNCQQLQWQVLNWNEPAINFYKKYDTVFDDEWINCKIIL
ncbi:MAG TPA: GNAT family N-acetyltransferase [Bacteroidia bacterium]|nr:GNAT family N-acetyltransferase [Bacteroidia bacterium]MBP7714671.1 GNAT family N-acetyltransferase [Bacteroidia bacterium]MBP8667597.1 GNAT family N-acetyltransferase [Bacteroidia bacterium]HOZ82327.1 GNAT family N-acetyltransferase [Bacteroidia bacterium]HOZ90631.1 GNAT family N-acetyltransferase [Bacteroidia bacterium]